jgi:hypothetical protein
MINKFQKFGFRVRKIKDCNKEWVAQKTMNY